MLWMPGTSPGKEVGGERSAAMLYLHGGGWVAGDLETHVGVCGALAAASDLPVFALDYRRPPEHPFPGPARDAVDALAWVRREARRAWHRRRDGWCWPATPPGRTSPQLCPAGT